MPEKTEHISIALARLVPGAVFSIRAFPNSDAERADPNFAPVINWNGPGAMPSNQAILSEIATIKAEESTQKAAKQAKFAAIAQARADIAALDTNALDMSQAGLRSLLGKIILALGV